MAASQPALTPRQVFHAFKSADVDRNANLSSSELVAALKTLKLDTAQGLSLSTRLDEVDELLRSSRLARCDGSHTSRYSFDEFAAVVKAMQLQRLFASIDRNHDGVIETRELRAFFERNHVDVGGSSVEDLLGRVDGDGSGSVDMAEFFNVFLMSAALDAKALATAWSNMRSVDTGSDLCTVPPPASMPVWRFLMAGGTAGVVSRTLTAPLERLTILMQTQRAGARASMQATLRALLARDGARGLFAGNGANLLRVFPFGGVVCITYSSIIATMPSRVKHTPAETAFRGCAGAIAGATAMTVTYPLDVIKTRLSAVDGSKYRGVLHCVRSIMAREGVTGLYRGIVPSVGAIAPFLAVQQSSYDFFKASVASSANPTASTCVVLGAAAGLCAHLVTHPFDTVRRQMQLDEATGGIRSGWQAARRVFRAHGMRGLYAGFTASALKVMPAVATSLLFRDMLLGRVDSDHKQAKERVARQS